MTIIFWFLSFVMFLDSILLILLVLVQQPKKDAGAGMAFGGSTADALFGAGSGNALTTITKYSAGLFFGLALLMAVITSHRGRPAGSLMEDTLTKPGAGGIAAPATTPSATSNLNLAAPLPTMAPGAAASNSVPAATNQAEKPAATPAPSTPAAPATTNK